MKTTDRTNSGVAPWTYTTTARVLHWGIALLLGGMVALGWYMMSIEKQPNSGWYFDLHKSVGITILGLVLLRLLWRITHHPRNLPSWMPRWQSKLATLTQTLLYVVMLMMPITGLTGALLSKDGVSFFGIKLPHPAPNHDLSEQLFAVHGIIVWILIGLASIHIAGALKHLLVDHDGVFQRMWPTKN